MFLTTPPRFWKLEMIWGAEVGEGKGLSKALQKVGLSLVPL